MPQYPTPLERFDPAVSHRPKPEAKYNLTQGERPTKPAHLGESGSQAWETIWDKCYWIHTEVDLPLVLEYCEALDELDEVNRIIGEEGLQVLSSKGQPMRHPLLPLRRDLKAQIKDMRGKMGLSSADRAKIGIEIKTAPIETTTTTDAPAAKRERKVAPQQAPNT